MPLQCSITKPALIFILLFTISLFALTVDAQENTLHTSTKTLSTLPQNTNRTIIPNGLDTSIGLYKPMTVTLPAPPPTLQSTQSYSFAPVMFCNNRIKGLKSEDDFSVIQLHDGFIWIYELITDPKGGKSGNPDLILRLTVTFVCVNQDGTYTVLARNSDDWKCEQVTPSLLELSTLDPIIVQEDGIDFPGMRGLDCSGRSVDMLIRQATESLTMIQIAESYKVPYVFAQSRIEPAIGAQQSEACGTHAPLFSNSNLKYGLNVEMRSQSTGSPNDAEMSTHRFQSYFEYKWRDIYSISLESPEVEHNEDQTIYTHMQIDEVLIDSYVKAYSSTFWETGLFSPRQPYNHVQPRVNGDVGVNGIIDLWLSANETSAQIGYDETGAFCGKIKSLIVDPFTGPGVIGF